MKDYYMDHAATTPLSKDALEAMMPYLTTDYGNASTVYTYGQRAKAAVERSRRTIAATIGAKPSEIYFTSGGTESDNWALIGAAEAGREQLHQIIKTHADRALISSAMSSTVETSSPQTVISKSPCGHIITDQIDHHAILNTCAYLEKRGFDVTYLPVDREGHVDPDAVMAAIRPDTLLVSIMVANNEIGTIEPIAEIGARLQKHAEETGQRILFHTDAVQAYAHIPLDVDELRVDLMSASSHKLNGPKGIGFLYVRRGVKLPSFLHGGEQERGRRAGTENVAGIVGFARAAELACGTDPQPIASISDADTAATSTARATELACSTNLQPMSPSSGTGTAVPSTAGAPSVESYLDRMAQRIAQESAVRDHLIQRLLDEIPYTSLNGDPTHRLPNNVNVCFKYIEGETLLLLLNEKHIYASAGSACASGSLEPSHVLRAIGVAHEDAYGSLRLTIGPETTIADVDEVVDLMKPIIAQLREQSPLYPSSK
ncbi:MAG: aminotransferase class V-fold PLP-dependent enzyme [Lachnospiraceae bacterium]|nr:aminotransferase class V-fold PLP-dependent enzyme [Lachnospiraceae bacterium]